MYAIRSYYAHPEEESVSGDPVDHPVVVPEAEVHHRSDDDRILPIPFHHDGALDDLPHPEDADLRLVENRRSEKVPLPTRIGDAEGSPGQFVREDLLRLGPRGEILHRPGQFKERFPVGVPDHRDNQSYNFV